MSLSEVVGLARSGRLYPSVIVHGGDPTTRMAAAIELARALLCERDREERPCGACRHCRRIEPPGGDLFHPDLAFLERDLKTATSVEATKRFLTGAQVTPFEARGQVFVVVAAETLSGEAANALLKNLEEPHVSAPRHFLLLAPSQFDLLPTLRSRSLAVFLGGGERPGAAAVEERAEAFAAAVEAALAGGGEVELLAAAEALHAGGGWDDPRARAPWEAAAECVLTTARSDRLGAPVRRRLLALAEALLEAPSLRVRGIQPLRILEGRLSEHLGALAGSGDGRRS